MSGISSTIAFKDNAAHITTSPWVNSPGKRVFDVVTALALTVPALIIMPLIAIGIKYDDYRGDVLFKQKRVGRNGQLFTIYKFRTHKQELCDPAGREATVKNDARVTPFGRFLRKTHLDELPQIFNVFTGDLSMVGPRPLVQADIETIFDVDYQKHRHAVKPGVTFITSLKGRHETEGRIHGQPASIAEEKDYIASGSLRHDVETLWKTPRAMICSNSF